MLNVSQARELVRALTALYSDAVADGADSATLTAMSVTLLAAKRALRIAEFDAEQREAHEREMEIRLGKHGPGHDADR